MEALLIHQDESDSIVDKLEEYGLNENEYELLKSVVQRPAYPLDHFVKMTKQKAKDISISANGLISLGYIREDKSSKNRSLIPTKKGKEVKRILANLGKNNIDEPLDPNDNNEIINNQDELFVFLSNLMEVTCYISSIRKEAALSPEWLQILVIMKGHGKPLTASEIGSYIPDVDLEILRTKLKNKTTRKERKDLKWIKDVSDEEKIEMYAMTEDGENALELALLDWKMRLE